MADSKSRRKPDVEGTTVETYSLDYEPTPELKDRPASEDQCAIMSEGENPCQVQVGDRIVMAYDPRPAEIEMLRSTLGDITYVPKVLNGQSTESVQFGFQPGADDRAPHRAGELLWSRKYRKQSNRLYMYAELPDKLYKEAMKEDRLKHLHAVNENIPKEWRLSSTAWTNGIVNKGNALVLHRDGGSYNGAATGTIVLQKGIEGGAVVFPEIGFGIKPKDGARMVFDGQLLLHGVTPFRVMEEGGYRFSVVYYTLSALAIAKQK